MKTQSTTQPDTNSVNYGMIWISFVFNELLARLETEIAASGERTRRSFRATRKTLRQPSNHFFFKSDQLLNQYANDRRALMI